MKQLYKYMPFTSLIKFINDPCLRITPSYCQNDPFECGFTDHDIEQLDTKYNTPGLGQRLKDFSNLHGIISLSKTEQNIPMWAHYAANHKGAVIQFNIDEDDPLSIFYNERFKYADFLFNEVKYLSERHFPEIGKKNERDSILQHYYFSKACAWDYEEEYRYIIPFANCNRVLFSQRGYKRAEEIIGDRIKEIPINEVKCDKCLNCKTGKECKNKTYEWDETNLTSHRCCEPSLLQRLWNESNGADIMFFLRLKPENIGNIYLGTELDIQNLKEEFNEIEINDNHHKIDLKYYDPMTGDTYNPIRKCHLFTAEIDSNNYTLNFNHLKINLIHEC